MLPSSNYGKADPSARYLHWWFGAFGSLAIFFPLVLYLHQFYGSFSVDQTIWSDFGQYFGGVASPAISALALAALIGTLRLQQRQIDEANKRSKITDFETTLKYYLETITGIMDGIDLHHRKTGAVIARGSDVFRSYYNTKLKKIYADLRKNNPAMSERDVVRQSFDDLYQHFGSNFGHYFRTLYRSVAYVDKYCPAEKQREEYIAMITCRLNKFEVLLLTYNCLGSIGERKFKGLVEKYQLLEYIDAENLLSYEHLSFFKRSAIMADAV